MIIHNFKLYTNKINKHILITLDSDWHISPNGSLIKPIIVHNTIRKLNPDIRIIAGDLIDDTSTLKGINKKRLISLLEQSQTICPTIVALGNHDISKISFIDGLKWHQDLNIDWYQEIENNTSSKLVYNNKIYEGTVYLDNKIEIICLNPPYLYYFINKEEPNSFLNIYQNKNINFITDESYYHILVIHSSVAAIEVINDIPVINNADLILSGHMHGGMVPFIARKLGKLDNTHYGIFTPNEKVLWNAKYCYGKIIKGNKTFLINPGITKLGPEKGIISNLNFIYPSEIYKIDLIPTKKRILKK